jgi:hypothetical protein
MEYFISINNNESGNIIGTAISIGIVYGVLQFHNSYNEK